MLDKSKGKKNKEDKKETKMSPTSLNQEDSELTIESNKNNKMKMKNNKIKNNRTKTISLILSSRIH